MIGFLTGKIISSKPTRIILDVNGVGYAVNISINTFESISDKLSVSLFIHTNVKEDSITLYGFYSEGEKEMFELLISVSGIGPKLAISILSGIQASELKNAVLSGDISRMTAVPGIGRKTAERVVLELKSKVDRIAAEGEKDISQSIKDEAVAALTTLGYNFKTADNTIRDILSSDKTIAIEDLIKKALSRLNK